MFVYPLVQGRIVTWPKTAENTVLAADGWIDIPMDGQTDGWTDRWMDRRMYRQTCIDGQTEPLKEQHSG